MVKKADEKKLLDKFTYGELLDELEHIWRKTAAKGPVQSSDPYWVHLSCSGKRKSYHVNWLFVRNTDPFGKRHLNNFFLFF